MGTGMMRGFLGGLALALVVTMLLSNYGTRSVVCAGDIATSNGKWLAWSVSSEEGKEYALLFNTETESLATYGVTRSGEIGMYSVRLVSHDFGLVRQLNNASDTHSVKEMEDLQAEAAGRQKPEKAPIESKTK